MKAYENKSMTVADLIQQLETMYPNKNMVIVADMWDEDDIRDVARDMNIGLDREECRIVAAYIDNSDSEQGLSDNRIISAINAVIAEGLINP